jgi:hypothetical protein
MRELALAKAMTAGPRVLTVGERKIMGYYATPNEIREIYAKEGFKTDRNQHLNKALRWQDRGDTQFIAGHAVFSVADNMMAISLLEKAASAQGITILVGVE